MIGLVAIAWLALSLVLGCLIGRAIHAGAGHLDERGGPPVIGRDARVGTAPGIYPGDYDRP